MAAPCVWYAVQGFPLTYSLLNCWSAMCRGIAGLLSQSAQPVANHCLGRCFLNCTQYYDNLAGPALRGLPARAGGAPPACCQVTLWCQTPWCISFEFIRDWVFPRLFLFIICSAVYSWTATGWPGQRQDANGTVNPVMCYSSFYVLLCLV